MKVQNQYLMTEEEGTEWNAYKASLGPIYPGFESFDTYLRWTQEKLKSYGCIDFKEHHWTFNTYRVNDWPDHDAGALGLTIDGREYPVGTFLMLAASTGEEGITAPMMFYDAEKGEPEENAFSGKIVVMKTHPWPEKPYTERFLESYVITDTNYRSDPEPPAPLFETVDPRVNNSWNTRWDFGCWGELNRYAKKGNAEALIVLSNLTWGCLKGLYDRQMMRGIPAIAVDRETSVPVLDAALNEKCANVRLISRFFDADAWNYICFLPGRDYGTDRDEYVTINCHVDAMSLTQDNGSVGAIGIARYFSRIPQSERRKTLLFCIDSRHFIEGFEMGNFKDDPYQVFPEIQKKVTVTVGLEHMGELEGAEDYEQTTMICTGRPEFTFMKADDNDWCARTLIDAAMDSGLERADIKIDFRKGINGKYKGLVRAVQASCHRLDVCVIGQAGNWPGAHTQIFSGMQYFGPKKFRDEVHLWTQVVGNLMEADTIVYDKVWSDLNKAIRDLASSHVIGENEKETLLDQVRFVFADVENGDYRRALVKFEQGLKKAFETAMENIDHPSDDAVIKAEKSIKAVLEKLTAAAKSSRRR